MGSVVEFESSGRWQLHYNEAKLSPKLMVVNFSASWSGPCMVFEPYFNSLSCKYEEIDFIMIDVDESQDVAKQFEVHAIPTLVMLKQGNVVERVVGAKEGELKRKILKNREAPKSAA